MMLMLRHGKAHVTIGLSRIFAGNTIFFIKNVGPIKNGYKIGHAFIPKFEPNIRLLTTLEAYDQEFPHLIQARQPENRFSIISIISTGIFLLISFITKNSSGDEIANMNFLYDDIVHALQNTVLVR